VQRRHASGANQVGREAPSSRRVPLLTVIPAKAGIQGHSPCGERRNVLTGPVSDNKEGACPTHGPTVRRFIPPPLPLDSGLRRNDRSVGAGFKPARTNPALLAGLVVARRLCELLDVFLRRGGDLWTFPRRLRCDRDMSLLRVNPLSAISRRRRSASHRST
jgi:hypothetical protein